MGAASLLRSLWLVPAAGGALMSALKPTNSHAQACKHRRRAGSTVEPDAVGYGNIAHYAGALCEPHDTRQTPPGQICQMRPTQIYQMRPAW
jgi:hypothetical protein